MDASPLALLPGELRNTIYTHILINSYPIDITYPTTAREPGLLTTCRQIRHEVSAMYYSENSFLLHHNIDRPVDLSWACALGFERASMVRRFLVAAGKSSKKTFVGQAGTKADDSDPKRDFRGKYFEDFVTRLAWWGVRLESVEIVSSEEGGEWTEWKRRFDRLVGREAVGGDEESGGWRVLPSRRAERDVMGVRPRRRLGSYPWDGWTSRDAHGDPDFG